jgi:hypothetical protein
MSGPQPPRQLGRSFLALVTGIIVGIVLSLGTDVLLHVVGLWPSLGQPMTSPMLLLATGYRTVYGVISSYITARLAPHTPMTHALALGMMGFFVNLIGAVTTWNKVPSLGPHWYPVALTLLAIPTAWLGGMLRERQLTRP